MKNGEKTGGPRPFRTRFSDKVTATTIAIACLLGFFGSVGFFIYFQSLQRKDWIELARLVDKYEIPVEILEFAIEHLASGEKLALMISLFLSIASVVCAALLITLFKWLHFKGSSKRREI